MPRKDPRVDAYIARAAPFARPVLTHLRSVVLAAVPDAEETIKWGMPHYVHHGIVCCIAGFKGHCALHLRRGNELLGDAASDAAMGQFGRIASLADLPPKAVLVRLLRKAAALNEAGEKAPPAPRKPARPAPRVPADLAAAMRKSPKARETFQGFSPSKRRDYVDWILEAKGKDTRAGRIATAIGWMEEGKARNWKYEKC